MENAYNKVFTLKLAWTALGIVLSYFFFTDITFKFYLPN